MGNALANMGKILIEGFCVIIASVVLGWIAGFTVGLFSFAYFIGTWGLELPLGAAGFGAIVLAVGGPPIYYLLLRGSGIWKMFAIYWCACAATCVVALAISFVEPQLAWIPGVLLGLPLLLSLAVVEKCSKQKASLRGFQVQQK